jgi:hypothetical protein
MRKRLKTVDHLEASLFKAMKPGIRGLEAALAKIERPKVVFKIDVQPLTNGGRSFADFQDRLRAPALGKSTIRSLSGCVANSGGRTKRL